MTANQIKYAEYLETKRHNKELEHIGTREVVTQEMNARTNRISVEESQRHNLSTETLTSQANTEIQRHNQASELISSHSLEESVRHNKESEALTARTISENERHNKATENLTSQQLQEVQRHNLVGESQNALIINETHRHNVASEGIGRTQAQAAMISAGAATVQAQAAKDNAVTNAKNAATNSKNAAIHLYEAHENVRIADEKRDTERLRIHTQATTSLVSTGSGLLGTIFGGAMKLAQ